MPVKLKLSTMQSRPTLMDCVLRQRFIRAAVMNQPSVQDAYEAAVAEIEAGLSRPYVPPTLTHEPIAKLLMPVGIDAVDDNEPEVTPDIDELGYVAPIVAGADDGELVGENDEVTEGDVADEPELEEQEEAA